MNYQFQPQETVCFRASKAPGTVMGRFHFQGINKYLIRYRIDERITEDWFEENFLEKKDR